jgi:hypothetical protein
MTTPKSNPSKHYKHFRRAIAFPFRKLEVCRHCRFRAGSFQDFRPGFRFWHICVVDRHGRFTLKQLRLRTCAKWNAYKLIYRSYTKTNTHQNRDFCLFLKTVLSHLKENFASYTLVFYTLNCMVLITFIDNISSNFYHKF